MYESRVLSCLSLTNDPLQDLARKRKREDEERAFVDRRARERAEVIQSCARSLALLDRRHAEEHRQRFDMRIVHETNSVTRKRAKVYEERLRLGALEDELDWRSRVLRDGPDTEAREDLDRLRKQRAAVTEADLALKQVLLD